MTKEEIIEALKLKKKFLEECIRDRANECIVNEDVSMDDLLDLDMDKFPVANYCYEDSTNHAFDLGGWYYLNNILKLCENE